MKNTNSICWRHKTATSFSHLVAEIVFVFLIVYLTGSSSEVISHQALSFFEEKRYTFQERRNWSSGCNGKWRRRSKKAAKYITKSNIESGVAYTIRELLKRQGGKADGENIRNL